MNKRDLKNLHDLNRGDIQKILDLAAELKNSRGGRLNHLNGKSVGLIFQKPSNRTRVSFEVGIWELGGNCIYLGPEEIHLGKRESVHDVAKTLSRYLSAIVARTFHQKDIEELARHASVPVINGLSDLYHPCQALTDIFSIREKLGDLKGKTVAFIGDGNNVCHSLLLACAKVGTNVRVACPKGYQPDPEIVGAAKRIAGENGSEIIISNSPREAAKDAHVLYGDVWISMGQEKEEKKRLKIFKPYQINEELAHEADTNFIFMHCLPAHRDQEVATEIIDGKHSIVFDQAENRLHVQKAILLCLMQGETL